ncbi:MAG: sulfite exporter TauE/SafE family protein [Actinomycetota bacterium]|nr:sulfite exporter TauE/SafE family protein [Actinomycetota bacterium]
MIVNVGLGLLIGLLLGLLGGGGSIMAVPALVYGAGMPLSSAVPTSLVVVGLSSAGAVLPRVRSGQVEWSTAGVFGAAGAAAAFAGAAVNRLLAPRLVLAGFAVLMVAAGAQMLRAQTPRSASGRRPAGGKPWRSYLPRVLGAGFAVGFLTGLFGIGGGFLIVPALVLVLGVPMEVAIGTSLLVIVITSAAGFVAHTGHARLDFAVTAAFTLAAVAGSLAGALVSRRVAAGRLRRWFAYLVFAVAAYVLAEVGLNPVGLGS